MPALFTVDDVLPLLPDVPAPVLAIYVEDAVALAGELAPCLRDPYFTDVHGSVRAILRAVVQRRAEAGAGMVTKQTAGIYEQTIDTTSNVKSRFWPEEIQRLQAICAAWTGEQAESGAWSIRLAGSPGVARRSW